MKNKTALFLFIAFCFGHFSLIAHEIPFNKRFKGGEVVFIGFMSDNIKYPAKSVENNIIGYSITGISITPKGDIADIFTVNPLSEEIDQQVIAALLKTEGKWVKSDTLANQTFYVQVIFQILNPGVAPNTNNSLLHTHNFVEPVFITEMNPNKKEWIETDESVGKKISKNIKNDKPDEAITYVDELIRRNPFNKELYQLRISLNNKLKRSDLVTNDVNKLENFIPGVSLDDFLTAFAEAQEKEKMIAKEAAPKNYYEITSDSETKAEFPGGLNKMMQFISRNLKYPNDASRFSIQGTVLVRFIVQKDGKISNATIVRNVHPLLDAEALRVVKLMPDWTPATKDGKAVNVYFTMPIKFALRKEVILH